MLHFSLMLSPSSPDYASDTDTVTACSSNSGAENGDVLLDGALFLTSHWDFNTFATLLWSSTVHGTNKAWAHGMNQENPSVSYYPSPVVNAFATRCIKD